MTAATMTSPQYQASPGLWTLAWRRLLADRIAMFSMIVVMAFFALMLASGTGLVASKWADEVAVGYAPPSLWGLAGKPAAKSSTSIAQDAEEPTENLYPGTVKDPLADEIAELKAKLGGSPVGAGDTPMKDIPPIKPAMEEVDTSDLNLGDLKVVDPLAAEMAEIMVTSSTKVATQRVDTLPFGADKWGHDVIAKVIKGSETSIFVGLAAALVATIIGTLLGAISGYYGGWLDDFLNWFYSIFTAIPYLLLILAIAAVLNQKGVTTIVLILGLTGWTGVYRLVRAEYIKHSTREYVQAADAIGASNMRRMFVHIFPNVSHISLVQLSVHTVGFIKSEVILSFLGFGVPVDKVSWGSMLGEAQNELILGYWWQLAAATIAMAILVTAFSMFTDALRDALDPKIK